MIDCDPGIDDLLAILLAFSSDRLDVKLITTCAGNQTIHKVTANALKLLHFLGRDAVEVARGAAKPLRRNGITADEVHGPSGFGEVELERPAVSESARPALEAMRDVIRSAEQKVTIIAIAPLTNIACLFIQYPEVIDRVERLLIMGGAVTGGNRAQAAEFNMRVDPDAADIVFRSGVPIAMFGLDVTSRVTMRKADLERIRRSGGPVGQTVARMLDYYFRFDRAKGVHDPCPVAYLIDPSLFRMKACHVVVETKGEWTGGQTAVDMNPPADRPPNADVAVEVERERLLNILCEAVKKYE